MIKALLKNRTMNLFLFYSGLTFINSYSIAVSMREDQMVEVEKIAKTIKNIRSNLPNTKYMEYAIGIYQASQKYQIDPNLLIAITQQETAFRENLPEGKAGELGICQIRKMWIRQPKFRAEFKTAKIKDLHNPEKSFKYAAWLLSSLRQTVKKHTIPYWSYYNAVRFTPRLRYYVSVNRHLAMLRNRKSIPMQVLIAKNDFNNEESSNLIWTPENRGGELIKSASSQTTMEDNGKGWVPLALRKLQNKNSNESLSPLLIGAGLELNIPSLFGSLPIANP